ncbi:unnamed protein product, partial [Hymenolepis diminuta]
RIHESSTVVKSLGCLGHCNHIGAKPALLVDKCKQSEEMGYAKPTSLTNGTVSKVIAQNTDEAELLYHQDLIAPKLMFLGPTVILILLELSGASSV